MARTDSDRSQDSGQKQDSGPAVLPLLKKRMAKIIRNWIKLNRADRVDFGQKIVDNVTAGGTAVPATNADYVAFAAAQTELKSAAAEIKALEQKLAAARLAVVPKMDTWLAATEQMAKTTDSLAKGTAAAIAGVGFQPSSGASPAPSQPMTQVQALSLTAGDNDGELDYTHERNEGATGYERETTTNPNDPASWVDRDSTTRSSGTLSGLPSGSRQWVRIRAIGPLGPGPWSDPATKTVP